MRRGVGSTAVTKVALTRRGDSGETSLVGGQRLAKDDLRIEAYGTVDELNSFIGLARESAVELAGRAPALTELAAILRRDGGRRLLHDGIGFGIAEIAGRDHVPDHLGGPARESAGLLKGLYLDGAFSMPAKVAASKMLSCWTGWPKYLRAAASTPKVPVPK